MVAGFYLRQLIIQNFATFKNQTINFRPGFNAIVGETGSGKSLVLDALQLILGGRADKKVVRRETDYSLIEASFILQDDDVKKFLESEGYPTDGSELVIKRLVYRNGTTKNYINHLSCTVGFLASFARKFIDLVGQFENQKLLSDSYQLYLLDHFARQLEDVEGFHTRLLNYKELKKQQESLIHSKSMREQRLDYLNFQLQEIEKLNPSSQDEEDLLKKKSLMMSLEKQQKLSFQFAEVFEGDEGSIGIDGYLKQLSHHILKNPDLFSEEASLLAEAEDRLQSLRQSIDRKLSVELDPESMEQVLDRLDTYQRLKKKFGGSVEAVLQTQVDFLKEKAQLESLDFNLDELEKKNLRLLEDLKQNAGKLHKKRAQSAKRLGEELTAKVRNLKMNGATIRVETEELSELTDSGITKAFFIAETNPGEGFFRIKDIASGGELSRILLALRQILSSHDSISIFLFDEIDTGIGGETATYIGKALAEVALHGQVIAITHLPQIAQFAEALVIVQKDIHAHDKEARTESSIKEVIGKMVMKEVKAMANLAQ